MTTSDETNYRPTVLCVDDEPNVLKALEHVLRHYGCRVLSAHNANEAIEVLKQEQVEVLISDEAMPGMRGTEMLRWVKVVAPTACRVLLTGHCGDQSVVIPAVNDGEVFRLLAKPWMDEDIRGVIRDALGSEPAVWAKRRQRMAARLEAYGAAPAAAESESTTPADLLPQGA